jgi:hypothetical protein
MRSALVLSLDAGGGGGSGGSSSGSRIGGSGISLAAGAGDGGGGSNAMPSVASGAVRVVLAFPAPLAALRAETAALLARFSRTPSRRRSSVWCGHARRGRVRGRR